MGKILFVIGLLGIAFTAVYDKLVGKGEIVFGPKSYTAFALGVVVIIAGLATWKK